MSIPTPVKDEESNVHSSEGIRSDDKPVEEVKPVVDTATGDETATQDATPANG